MWRRGVAKQTDRFKITEMSLLKQESINKNPVKTTGVTLPFTLKSIKAKEEFLETQIFHDAKL